MPRPAYTPLDVEQQEETRAVQIPNVLRREEPSRSARRGRRLLRLLHANDPLVAFYCSCLVNLPQIIAVIVVFAYFNENKVCSVTARRQWRAWGIVHALRLTAGTLVSAGRARLAATAGPPPEPEGRRRLRALAANARNSLDALALIWFVVGNGCGCSVRYHQPHHRRLPRLGMSSVRHRCGHARHPVRADLFAVFVCRSHGARVLLLPALCDSVISSIARSPTWARGYSARDLDKLPTCPFSRLRPTEGRGAVLPRVHLRLRRMIDLRVLPCSLAASSMRTAWTSDLAVNATGASLCRSRSFVPDSDVESPTLGVNLTCPTAPLNADQCTGDARLRTRAPSSYHGSLGLCPDEFVRPDGDWQALAAVLVLGKRLADSGCGLLSRPGGRSEPLRQRPGQCVSMLRSPGLCPLELVCGLCTRFCGA